MKKQKIIFGLVILSAIGYLLFAVPVSAAGLIPCGRCAQFKTDIDSKGHPITTCAKPSEGATAAEAQPCTVCHFFVLIQNIINFIILVSASLAALAVIYIAFLFMFSGGSPAKITDAKGKLWLLVRGIFWVLGSWLVLNTILNFLVDKKVFPWPWNEISCEVSQPSSSTAAPSFYSPFQADKQFPYTNIPTGNIPGTYSEAEARQLLAKSGITINKNPCQTGVPFENVPGGCTSLNGVKSTTVIGAVKLAQECAAFNNVSSCNVQVTAGTEAGHKEISSSGMTHANGWKLDFSSNNSMLNAYIESLGKPQTNSNKETFYASGKVLATREKDAKYGDHWDVLFRQ